jgi:hypothetical protein
MIDDLPNQWRLPAAESQVLLAGPTTPNEWAIKLALKELVLRRVLSVRTVRVRRFRVLRKDVDILVDGKFRNVPVSGPLQRMLSVFPQPTFYGNGISGVPIQSAALEVMRWYRAGGGYVEAEVLPELRRLGLFEQRLENGLPRWRLTPEGEEALVELRALMQTGREQFPRWVETDRARTMEFVGIAGPALLLLGNPIQWIWVLLMESLSGDQSLAMPGADPFPDPQALESRTDSDGGDRGVVVGGGGGREPEETEEAGKTIDEEVDHATDAFGDGGDGGAGDGE